MVAANPVLVEVTRGAAVESWHRGAFAVLHADGRLEASAGDIERPVYPRSAVKPLQAIPLVESGAARHFALGAEQLALACASHGGENQHTERVAEWLARLSLATADLECGAHLPLYEPAAAALLAAGRPASALHNNCSGKHAGFLTLARHLGAPTRGYPDPAHPSQTAWQAVLAELGDYDVESAPRGVDGCGIAVIGIPLRNLALAMARFAVPAGLAPARGAAVRQIQDAMRTAPALVAGTGRLCTAIMQVAGQHALVKTGAEGVYSAALPRRGLGVALKMDDGGKRAAECAITALLHALDAFDPPAWRRLAEREVAPLLNATGRAVGVVQPTEALRLS